jgi:glycosyltransferase involved in cell wall biosynthesis
MISVLVITKNEEFDIGGCLDSVSWSDDIKVVDSFSTDATVDIARSRGADVFLNEFLGYSSQRNFGLSLDYKYDWILILDADERVPSQLASDLRRFCLEAGEEVSAARFRRRDIWWGKWLRWSQISPFFIRLIKKGRGVYVREVNEVLEVDGVIEDIDGYFDHYPFSKGVAHWVSKHNNYSTMEAEYIVSNYNESANLYLSFFSRDFNVRRLHQKRLFYKLPFRPFVKLFYMLFFRLAIFDGFSGVRYSILQSIYEYLIVLKTRELRSRSL